MSVGSNGPLKGNRGNPMAIRRTRASCHNSRDAAKAQNKPALLGARSPHMAGLILIGAHPDQIQNLNEDFVRRLLEERAVND
jgi:hypothetical protein